MKSKSWCGAVGAQPLKALLTRGRRNDALPPTCFRVCPGVGPPRHASRALEPGRRLGAPRGVMRGASAEGGIFRTFLETL